MAIRVVFLSIGRKHGVAPVLLETSSTQVTLSILDDDHIEKARRVLTHLHLIFTSMEVPHTIECASDSKHLLVLQSLTTERAVANREVFPILMGMADEASVEQGVH